MIRLCAIRLSLGHVGIIDWWRVSRRYPWSRHWSDLRVRWRLSAIEIVLHALAPTLPAFVLYTIITYMTTPKRTSTVTTLTL